MASLKPEKHAVRDLRFYNFHRTLDRSLYLFDMDGIWFDDNGNPILLAELKHWKDTATNEFQIKCCQSVANKLFIPFLKIYYYPASNYGNDLITHEPEPNSEWKFRVSATDINDLGFDLYQTHKLNRLLNADAFEQLLLTIRGNTPS